jgi:hypothetical protein
MLIRRGLTDALALATIKKALTFQYVLGRRLLKPIRQLGDWAGQNRDRIQIARDRYDAHPADLDDKNRREWAHPNADSSTNSSVK